jgi:hypothetical protein
VEEVEVLDDADAQARRFPGSPTYLIAGADRIPALDEGDFQAEACRIYRLPGGRMGPLPDIDDLAGALASAAEEDA